MVRGHEVGSPEGSEPASLRGQSEAQSDIWDERREEQRYQGHFQYKSESDGNIVSLKKFKFYQYDTK